MPDHEVNRSGGQYAADLTFLGAAMITATGFSGDTNTSVPVGCVLIDHREEENGTHRDVCY